MAIYHIFNQVDFGDGFRTHNSILDITPYKPEVMFVGTFNPLIPGAIADFFYGRNFFWPAVKNLFVHDELVLGGRRMPANGAPPQPNLLDPTLEEILKLCTSLKLTFADMIQAVFHHNNPVYQTLDNGNVIYNGNQYNLIRDGINGNVGGLQQLQPLGQILWNTKNIIRYLCDNPQIKAIYFTRQPTGIWNLQWQAILNNPCIKDRLLTNIYTPSAILLPAPKMNSLLHSWVHNGNINFGQLNNNWLTASGVTLTNFL